MQVYKSILIICALALVLWMAVFAIDSMSDSYEHDCQSRSKMFGRPYRFDSLSGCWIEAQPGDWVPMNR